MIGDGVTIGHGAYISSATVEDGCLIGMGAILNPGSRVEAQSLVAAGAVIGRGVTVRSGELWAGSPAKKMRDLTAEEKERLNYQASAYVQQATKQNHVMELGGNVQASDVTAVEEAGKEKTNQEITESPPKDRHQ